MKEHRFDNGGIFINYAEGADNGPPLVLLHGGSLRWQAWRWVIDTLAARTHAFAPDLRGHGLSTWTPGSYRLFDYADDIAAFLERVVREPAILLGHSLGGEVALIVAALHPSSALAVIDEDGPLSGDIARRAIAPTRPMLEAMRDSAGSSLPDEDLIRHVADVPLGFETGQIIRFGDIPGVDEDELRWAAETARQNDPEMVDAVIEFEAMHAGYDEALLTRIECPVVVLLADPELGGLSEDEVAHAETLLRDGRWIRASGLGHTMHDEDPEWFARTVLGLVHDFSRVRD
ncbi:MAG: alpha/beta fold hydrolase [Actinomycetota bacterium]